MVNNVRIFMLPGGKLPERQTHGAIGYDACARAIVSAHEMDPGNPLLRKTINSLAIPFILMPNERCCVGLGFCTKMTFPMFYWVAPRSGLASKFGITVANAPGTVDPDYRGEAGAVILNMGDSPFTINLNMRIVQIIFQEALIPQLITTNTYSKLSKTKRGAGGFGSTGA